MITSNGKVYIKRYLAGQVPAIAQCIAYGLGGKSESAIDNELQFETGRADVTITSYDFTTDRVIFKAVLPDDFGGMIYEVGLYSVEENTSAGNNGSKMIATFDSGSEVWVDSSNGGAATYSTTTARIGGDALRLAPPAGNTMAFILNDLTLDLSGNSGADVFKIAYNVSGTVPASVTFRFRTDSANYYSFTTAAPAVGYHVESFPKGNAVVTGAGAWSSITGLEVIVVSGAGGVSTVDFDGVRLEDTDSVNPDYVLVSRELLASPYNKVEGQAQEIEFSLNVNV